MYNREGPKEKKRDTAPERMKRERSKRANQNLILVTVMRLRGRRVGHIAPSLPPRTDRGEAPLSLGQALSLQRLVG